MVKYAICPISIPYINFILEISRNSKLINLNFAINMYKNYFNKFFLKTFWKYFKSFIIRDNGVVTNNINKSFTFSTIYSINSKLWKKKSHIGWESHKHILNGLYLKPVSVFPFSFQNSTYNTLIFLIFNLINTSYISFKNDFKLIHSFILFQINYKIFYFCNTPYFKVFNY